MPNHWKRDVRRAGRGLYDPAYEHDSCGVGFIAHIKGRPSHDIVTRAIAALEHMDHRGASGCEENTGDGAGILTALPHAFLAKVAGRDAGLQLPPPGSYGTGLVFLPSDNEERSWCERAVADLIHQHRLTLLGWRDVPVDNHMLGHTARRTEPRMRMLFVQGGIWQRRRIKTTPFILDHDVGAMRRDAVLDVNALVGIELISMPDGVGESFLDGEFQGEQVAIGIGQAPAVSQNSIFHLACRGEGARDVHAAPQTGGWGFIRWATAPPFVLGYSHGLHRTLASCAVPRPLPIPWAYWTSLPGKIHSAPIIVSLHRGGLWPWATGHRPASAAPYSPWLP